MNEFAGVFFHMNARYANAFFLAFHFDIHVAVFGNRQIILGSLEVFRQIRIIIVFAVEFAEFVDGAVERQTSFDGKFHNALVYDRQNARQSQADWADMRILVSTEGSSAAAENFRIGF